MKKYIFMLLTGVAAVACVKNELESPQIPYKDTPVFHMQVNAGDPASKTVIEDLGSNSYAIKWQDQDALGVFEVGNSVVQSKSTSSPLELVDPATSATFSFTLSGEVSSPYDYTFVYPASALSYETSKYWVGIPDEQTFQADTFDPSADVLVSEHLHTDTRPSSVSARFARLGGTARMVISAPSTSETIQKIVFSTPEGILAGAYELNPASGELSEDPVSGSQTITLTPTSSTKYDGEVTVWFRTAACTLSNSFTVSVRTNAKTYTKTVYLASASREIQFRNGALTTFSVNMAGVAGVAKPQVDVIDGAFVGGNNTYASWSESKAGVSGAVYNGLTAKRTNGDIGLRVDDVSGNRPGIVSQSSSGYIKSVTVTIPTSSYTTRHFDIYAKNSAYESPNDMWDDGKKGTCVATINPSSTEVITRTVSFTDSYTFVAFRVTGGPLDVTSIEIEWTGSPLPLASATTLNTAEPKATEALLQGSYSGATSGICEAGFYYDTDAAALDNLTHPELCVKAASSSASSGNFEATATSLSELTTYYFKAYVVEFDASSQSYVKHFGNRFSFTTLSKAAFTPGGWLEMPSTTVDSSTTDSPLTDLYSVTHWAMMESTLQRNYSILYDPAMYASYWVAYPLCATHLGSGRDEFWAFDPNVPQSKQTDIRHGAYGVSWPTANYANNYFARGHQLPNADRNGTAASAMMEQTYYSTNLTPQLQYGFNGDIWKNLEEGVRSCVSGSDTVYVVTGAAFKKVGGSESITRIVSVRDGKELPVPNYYWKVLLKVKWSGTSVSGAKAIGFWLNHWETYSTASDAYIPCAVSVEQIEAWTGFDFFKNLSTDLQSSAETNISWNDFKNY